MLNKVMIIGYLGRDPELKYAPSGMPITNLRIATDESYTDRDGNKVSRTEWHSVVVFQRSAENCANYLRKGSLVFVEGSLQTRKWQDQSGQDRYTTEIKAARVQFLDRKGARQGEDGEDGAYAGEGGYARTGGRGERQAAGAQGAPQSAGKNQPREAFAPADDLGPAFPSEASGMDDVPF
jgi:single-strand DNA-binding protein